MGEDKVEISSAKMVVAALVLMLGGNAGTIFTATNPSQYRPDPFTGLDGAKLEARLMKTIHSQESELIKQGYQLDECMRRHKK